MKSKNPIFITLILLGCVLLVFTSCNRKPVEKSTAHKETIYDVKGVIREILPSEKQIVIEHETIPGYMDAMIMPFPVKDVHIMTGLAVDDAVKFQLVVTDSDAWISTIARVGSNNTTDTARTIESAEDTAQSSIKGGDEVPDFALTDQNGRVFRLKEFRGKPVVVTFIFTRCPLPTFCPLMSRNFAVLQKELSREYGDKFHLISISFDPAHDTPAILKDYANNFTKTFTTWSFATGSAQEIERVTALFGLVYKTEEGTINHTLRTALIDPHGRLVHIWKSNAWQPQEVLTMVREITRESSPSRK